MTLLYLEASGSGDAEKPALSTYSLVPGQAQTSTHLEFAITPVIPRLSRAEFIEDRYTPSSLLAPMILGAVS